MNSNLHDAFNLCECLVDVISGGDEGLLHQFDRQRCTVTHAFPQKQAIENKGTMGGGQGEAHACRRDKMRALLTKDVERRQYLLRQFMIDSLEMSLPSPDMIPPSLRARRSARNDAGFGGTTPT